MLSPTLANTTADCLPCYFTIVPTPYNHYSVETPTASPTFGPGDTPADPYNPLLAYRARPLARDCSSPEMSSNFMQLQSSAANGQSAVRPKPYPVQNVLHVTSDDSSSGSDSSSSSMCGDHSDVRRCSRCQRTHSIDLATGKGNMVQYGLNSWYCTRCAGVVGYRPR